MHLYGWYGMGFNDNIMDDIKYIYVIFYREYIFNFLIYIYI